MARSAKTTTDNANTPEDVVIGPVAEPTEAEAAVQDVVEPVAEEPVADSVLIVDPEMVAEPLVAPETPTAAPEPVQVAATPSSPVVKRVGVVPLFVGGVVAALLGFGAGWLLLGLRSDTTAEAVAAQAERIAGLESQIAALPEPAPAADLAPLTNDIASLRSEVTDQLAPLSDNLTALADRISALERAPAADGTLSETAIAGWEAEIETLRADIAAQEERMQALADAAAERLDAAQTTVTAIEENATASATSVLQRAAVSRMQAAVDTGVPFDAALADLTTTGVAVPDVLTAAAVHGVPTVAALSESFPEVARAALATARAEGLADDGDGRVMSFLRSQFDVRSVAPREGDDPDAILSRAEAALRDGHLSDSLAEVAALPEVVRADMTGWITQAESRVAVIAALQSLSETLPATSN